MISNNQIEYNLDLIEMNLKHGRPLDDEDDAQFTEDIIKSFHRLWKLLKQYPKLASAFDSDQFRRIYDDMSSDFDSSSTSPEHRFIRNLNETAKHPSTSLKGIDSCVPKSGNNESKNNDCVVDKCSSDESQCIISGIDIYDQQRYRTGKICDNDQSRTSSDLGIFYYGTGKCACNLCDVWSIPIERLKDHVEGRVHQKILGVVGKIYMSAKMANINDGKILSWSDEEKSTRDSDDKIEQKVGDTFCGVCNVQLNQGGQRRDHNCGTALSPPTTDGKRTVELESKKKRKSLGMKVKKHSCNSHRRKSKTGLFPESRIQNVDDNMKQISPEIEKIYHSNSTLRLSYFFHKICIFRSSAYPKYFTCGLCNIDTIDEEKSFNHILENVHKAKVAEVISACNVKSVSFEVAILSGHNVKNSRKCFLCNVRLPENDPRNYNTHLQTPEHQKRAKAHFKSRRFQEWEKGIILRNGEPYCIFCQSNLPTAFKMYQHITNPAHLRNLK